MEHHSNDMKEDLQDEKKTGAHETAGVINLKYLGLAVLVIVVVALIMQLNNGVDNCSQGLTDGYWSDKEWLSYHCVHYGYKRGELKQCLLLKPNVVLIGDGGDVTKYTALLEKEVTDNSVTVDTIEETDLTRNAQDSIYKNLYESVKSDSSFLVIQKLHQQAFKNCKATFPGLIEVQQQFLKSVNHGSSHTSSLIVVMAPDSVETDEETECREYVRRTYANISSPLHYIDVQAPPTSSDITSSLDTEQDLPIELVLTLNLFCNSPTNATCCVPSDEFRSFTTYIATCFLICVLAIYLGVWLIFISGATFALTPHLETMSFDFDKFFSVLHCVGGVTAVMFYLLLADRLDFFTRTDAPYSLGLFIVAIVTIIILAVVTITPAQPHDGPEVLSHDQCSEWRGWMILVIITSHYTGTDKLLVVRVMNELMVGAFLFLTGYTHFLHYWNNGSFSWQRLLKVLFQMNVLCLCVCLTLGSTYGSYYLVVVLSGWYLFVAIFTALWPSTSPGKLKRYTSPRVMVLIKFVIAFVLLALLRFTKEFWLGVLSLAPLRLVFESFCGCPEEIFYWFFQQRYTAFSGMTFAYITVTVGTSFKSIISQYEKQLKLVGALLSVLTILGYFLFLYTCDNQQECSSMQSYVGILPILAYVFLRNGNILHNYSSRFLKEAGTHSLWLFVSHFHILRASNGNGLFVLFPRLYYVNVAAVVVVYFYVFYIVTLSVNTLKKWPFPKKEIKETSGVTDLNV